MTEIEHSFGSLQKVQTTELIKTPETMSVQELAEQLNRSVSYLKRNVFKLYDSGLPHTLPLSNWMFARRAVELWLIAGGVIRRSDNSNAHGASLIELQQAALAEKYGNRL